MYYRTHHRTGIRDKRSGKQIPQFGGQDFVGLTKAELWEVGTEVVSQLVLGSSVEEAKDFANTKL